jgi:hypothetical protein
MDQCSRNRVRVGPAPNVAARGCFSYEDILNERVALHRLPRLAGPSRQRAPKPEISPGQYVYFNYLRYLFKR